MQALKRLGTAFAICLSAMVAHGHAAIVDPATRKKPVTVYYERFQQLGEGTVAPLVNAGDFAPLPPNCAPDRKPRLHGLLIGASEPGPARLRLTGPDNDVQLLGTALINGGATAADIRILKGATADRRHILDAVRDIYAELGCGDKVFIYFGGHAFSTESMEGFGHSGDMFEQAGKTSVGMAIQQASGNDYSPDEKMQAAKLAWYLDSGLTLLLNGEGEVSDGAGRNFDLATAADFSEAIVLFRNQGADVSFVIDARSASEAKVIEQQQLAASTWALTIEPANAGIEDYAIRRGRIEATAGDLAVFYSAVGNAIAAEINTEDGDRTVRYGKFTFRMASALQNRRDITVRALADALQTIVGTEDKFLGANQARHLVEATDPDMTLFAIDSHALPQADPIRILSPTPKRGAMPMEQPEVEIRGRVDWPEPAKAVLVQGSQATLAPNGEFTRTAVLKPGLNVVEIIALTAEGRAHEKRLEFLFEGDRKALEGEGKRYAVIIANQNYSRDTGFGALQTPFADAEAVAKVLSETYGFETELTRPDGGKVPLVLKDATGRDIQSTLHQAGLAAGEKDTVLVYYAGHGIYEAVTTTAFWVPIDAQSGVPFSYLSASAISEQLQRMTAGKIILISDSCYSGALLRGGGSEAGELKEADRTQALLRLASKRSRILISSGSNEPVEDLGGDGHSVFARALLTGLEQFEEDAFSARELFDRYIMPMVVGRSAQEPQFRPIEKSGHDGGDIVFVRTRIAAAAE